MASWLEFWNSDNTIYVNARHRQVHYRLLAQEIASLLPDGGARVLDFGSGDALSADLIADAGGSLTLYDGAESVRRRLESAFAGDARVTVLSPAELTGLPDGSFDVVFANSVVQYMNRDELACTLALLHAKLSDDGCLILGDVIPPSVGPLTDAAALLRFAWRSGFFVAALTGLVRTAFSDYRSLRGELGLLRFEEEEICEVLRRAGFAARRQPRNLGHNQARMTIAAMKCRPASLSQGRPRE